MSIGLAVMACEVPSGHGWEEEDAKQDDGGPELAPTNMALHEIAVLYPLPKNGDAGLIRASHPLGSGGGALLPAPIVDKLGDLVAGEPNAATYESLRVVGFRIEPCFQKSADDKSCGRQIRFVLQPVSVDPTGALETTTLDAAVHLIYSLPREAFVDLVDGIVAARPTPVSLPANAPLGVHPILASEGLSGSYARAIEGHVISAASKGHIARVTFLGARGRGNEWQLGGLEVGADGVTTSSLAIPGTSTPTHVQSIVLQRGSETPVAQSFAKSISPTTAAGSDDNVSLLFDSATLEAAPRDAVARALSAANRIENPNLRTSENTDCATCHTVASSRLWVEQKLALRDDRDRFVSPSGFDLASTTSRPLGDLGALRALGYFGTEPIVSPRAINDTAKAAAWIAASVSERMSSSSSSSSSSSASSSDQANRASSP